MDDDESYEHFEVKDADIEYALNPGRRHFQSKEEATYGIWADEDSDDDNKRPQFGKRKANNYSAPVSFVSGGIKVGEKIVNEHNEEKQSSSKPTADASFAYKPQPPKQKKQAGQNVFAGMRTSTSMGAPDPNTFCDWVKKGGSGAKAAMAMMSKMGYKLGEGLGKGGTGIVEPVQAQVRQGRGAVGAYGKESTGPKFGESAAEAQKRIAEENGPQYGDEEKEQVPKKSWKKNDRTKTRYKTIDEVIQEGGRVPAKLAQNNIKVVDMTGREQKVYRGYDSFTLKTRTESEEDHRQAFDVKELRHNLNLLVDMTETGIRRTNDQLRSLKDQSTALEYDVSTLRTTLFNEEKEARRMKDVYELIEQFSTMKEVEMAEIQTLFLKLKADFQNEYRLFNLETVAVPLVLPLLDDYFKQWQPLEPGQEAFGIDLMLEWKEILVENDKSLFTNNIHSFDQISAYDRLLWEGWLPALRRAALDWDPRDQMEEMLKVVEKWLPVLPEWMKENVIEQIIIPRISERVTSWDPTKDTIPIHSWVVPWLENLGDRLQPVLSLVRQKLAKVIRDKWDPADTTAKAILEPWVDVWAPSTMSAFLGQQIIPKLERFLDRIDLSPQGFQPSHWAAVMAWITMINADIMANILTRYFFPRWFEVLTTWLDAPEVSLHEVRSWFEEWRKRIPPALAVYPTIKENIHRALVAMAHALHGTRVAGVPIAGSQMTNIAAPPPPPPRQQAQHQKLSLKEVVEMSAAKYGLTYVPQRDRLKDGRQVFWFGSVSIYLDRGMVFCMDPKEFNWRAVRMEELLSLAGAGV